MTGGSPKLRVSHMTPQCQIYRSVPPLYFSFAVKLQYDSRENPLEIGTSSVSKILRDQEAACGRRGFPGQKTLTIGLRRFGNVIARHRIPRQQVAVYHETLGIIARHRRESLGEKMRIRHNVPGKISLRIRFVGEALLCLTGEVGIAMLVIITRCGSIGVECPSQIPYSTSYSSSRAKMASTRAVAASTSSWPH